MKMRLTALGLVLLATTLQLAATTPLDLGDGLPYLRITGAGDTPAVANLVAAPKPAVIDLRRAALAPDDALQLHDTLARRSAGEPLFILVGPQTPPDAVPALLPAGVLTLGLAGSRPEPRVIIAQSPEADLAARQALDAGTPLERLIDGRIEKERFDEASLAQEFANGNLHAEPPPTPDPTEPAAATAPPPAPVDRVLQRAVHLHRSLAALRSSAR